MQLRDYQVTPIEKAVKFFREGDGLPSLMVLPAAWGKSWLTAFVARSIEDGDRLLVLQPSKELLQQNYEKYMTLCGEYAEAGIYSASMRKKEVKKITYATIGSIKSKGAEFRELGFTKMLIDEAHLYPRKEESMIGRFLNDSGISRVLGITATPLKAETFSSSRRKILTDANGEPLVDKYGHPQTKLVFTGYSKQVILTNPSLEGEFYKRIIHVCQIEELIAGGYWSKLRYDVQAFERDLLELNSKGVEFTDVSVNKAYDANRVHDRIRQALAYYKDRKHCVVFVPNVEEAIRLSKETPGSAYVTSNMPPKERDQVVSGFKEGKIRVVFNVNVLSTGFDYPMIDLVVMGFSTASVAKYYQVAGRGVRISPEKQDCVIVDLCGNVKRFGRLQDLRYEYDGIWRLIGLKGQILSGVPTHVLGHFDKSYISRIREESDSLPTTLPYGKYKGFVFSEVPNKYMSWLLNKLDEEGDNVLLADAIRYYMENEIRDTTKEPALVRMPIGKHAGEAMNEIPKDYLQWFLDNTPRNKFNDSLIRGVMNGLRAPVVKQLSLSFLKP